VSTFIKYARRVDYRVRTGVQLLAAWTTLMPPRLIAESI